jgi:hypothetical protein
VVGCWQQMMSALAALCRALPVTRCFANSNQLSSWCGWWFDLLDFWCLEVHVSPPALKWCEPLLGVQHLHSLVTFLHKLWDAKEWWAKNEGLGEDLYRQAWNLHTNLAIQTAVSRSTSCIPRPLAVRQTHKEKHTVFKSKIPVALPSGTKKKTNSGREGGQFGGISYWSSCEGRSISVDRYATEIWPVCQMSRVE